MNEFKTVFTITAVGIVSVVFVYVFFGMFLQYEIPQENQEIDQQIQTWLSNKPEKFAYAVREGCMFMRSYQVIHMGEEVEYFDLSENKFNFEYMQILGIFEKLREASLKAEVLEVRYHPLGFPKSISIDWKVNTYDDECFIVVEDYQQI
jgi:hypothetical protein